MLVICVLAGKLLMNSIGNNAHCKSGIKTYIKIVNRLESPQIF